MCELLVGLPVVNVLGVVSRENEPLRVHVERVESVAGVVQITLALCAWADLARRPATQVRGPKKR